MTVAGDPLGRGWLTRWMPVFWQAPSLPPDTPPFRVAANTTPIRLLRAVMFSAKRYTIPAAALSGLHQVGEALVPLIAGAAIDQALATGDLGLLLFWLTLLAVTFLGLSLGFRFAAQLTALAITHAQHRLRATLSRRVLHPTGSASASRPDGGVVSAMTNDVSRVGALWLVVFPLGEVAGVVFIAISLLLLNPLLGLVVLVGAPIVVWLMGALSGRYARASQEYQTLLAGTVARATDLVTGYRVIRGIRAETEATRRYQDASRDTLHGAYRSVGALGRFLAGSDTISGVFIAGIAALSVWFAVTGQLSIGGMIAAVGLTQALLPPMQMFTGNALPTWAAGVASSARLLELLRTEDASPDRQVHRHASVLSPHLSRDSSAPVAEVPAVELTIASGAPQPVRVNPGELLGVRADDRTAAGAVAGLLRPGSDPEVAVTIGGVPAEQFDPADYRALVVVAPHQGTLFTGTIIDNLTLPGSPSSLRDVALRAAACEDFLEAAGGVNGQAGENGNRLSGGQRQRLALARGLATGAPILVLHDPTTAVDSVTEARIAGRLREIRLAQSTLLFTSSPALLAACDRIIDLRTEGAVS